jgi:hypothetical protein
LRTLRFAAALAVVYLIAACSTSGPSGPQAGTVSGTISSSLGGAIASATVTVTPTTGTAPASVQSAANGTYSVPNVPGGGGTVAVSTVPANCTTPAPASYSGVNANTITVNVQVTCAQTGTLMGTVTSSLTQGAGISGATVTVTPTGAAALPSVTTNSSGQYSVPHVPYGSGTIALSNLPAGCTASGASNYSLNSSSNLIDINVPCTALSTTTLNVGQAALFTDSPQFATNLTLAPNGIYLMAVVNTDSASSATEDFTLSGALNAQGASRVASLRAHVAAGPLKRRAAPRSARGPALDPQLARDLAFVRRAEAGHVARLDRDLRGASALRSASAAWRAYRAGKAALPGIRAQSLASTVVGDVNPINVPVPSCTQFTTIGARTVYVGAHVQIVADTSLTNWPAQYRPDSSYYTTLGQEYDTLTYAKHLLTYIGDPLQYDGQLLGAGKVTIVLTPVLNGESTSGTQGGGTILAFVSPCDLVPSSVAASSNETETIYHLVPSSSFSVAFWQREIRPTLAHESKHIVSLGQHIYMPSATVFEQVWLEEGLAQVSSEIWGRNYNTATWRGNAGFAETIGCEVTGFVEACNTPTSPYTFLPSHMAWLEQWLQTVDSVSQTLNGTTPGRYGAGWSIARWTIDQYASGNTPSAEAATIKALIGDVTLNGFANITSVTGASEEQTLLDWSLATAFDTVTLVDSATFIPTSVQTTIPSFDFRNIFSVAGNGGVYSLAAPLRSFIVNAGSINGPVTGVSGTDPVYIELIAGASGGTETLQLLSGAGGTISPASGFRVGIIRVQ